MSARAPNSTRFRIGCALALGACSFSACSTYDDALLAGYNSAIAANAGGGGSDAGRAGMTAVGGAAGNAGIGVGTAGFSSGDAGAGGTSGDAGAPPVSDAGAGTASAGQSSVGGTSSTGGTVGVAGSGVAGGAAGGGTGGASPYEMIDDFEDQDGFILSSHKRNGPWYVFNDMTKAGVESPNPFTVSVLTGANVRADSTAALHLTATGFTDWGAGVGADFVNQAAKKVPYDVSAYSGIHFYAKIASGTQSTMKVLFPNVYSDLDGGKCSDAVAGKKCSDHLFSSVSGLKTSWAEYQVNFVDLVQQGFGLVQATPWDLTGVYSMQFTFVTKALAADVWIDDVSFVKK